jgi:DNA-binding Lrp family transcriptional regulator
MLIREMPEVLECHRLTGGHDYQLKVVLRNRRELERFVVEKLSPIHGIARIHSSLVLTEVKTTTALPMGPARRPR